MTDNEYHQIANCYYKHLRKISIGFHNKGGGQARAESGKTFETTFEAIAKIQNADPVVGKKDLLKVKCGEFTKSLQVDRHVWKNNKRHSFVECKTYLDSCYLQRAFLNFLEIHKCMGLHADIKYAIFAGQNSVNKDTMGYYVALFKQITNKTMHLFFVNEGKRASTKSIAEYQFPLVREGVEAVYEFLS